MTLRLRFGIAGAVVALLLVALGLIISAVVTTSQIGQVDQQLTGALPRALVLLKSSHTTSHSSKSNSASAKPDVVARFSNIYIAVISGKTRHVLVTVGSDNEAPALPTDVTASLDSLQKIETVGSVKGSGNWRALLVRHSGGQEVLVAASLRSVDATGAQLRLVLLIGGAALVLVGASLWWAHPPRARSDR